MDAPIIRIMLVDNHDLVRASWKMLLQINPRFDLVAEANNGADALELVRLQLPDVIIVDINMSPMNGFELTEKVMAEHPAVRVIGLSVHNQPRYANRLRELGGTGYLTKTSPLDEINHGIIEVYHGKKYICREVRSNMTDAELHLNGWE